MQILGIEGTFEFREDSIYLLFSVDIGKSQRSELEITSESSPSTIAHF